MLVCKLEMWPHGDETKAREIGRVLIANADGTESRGSYDVVMPKSPEYARRKGVWKRGRVTDFPRQKLGPHDLLLRALVACIGDRSQDSVAQIGDAIFEDSINANAFAHIKAFVSVALTLSREQQLEVAKRIATNIDHHVVPGAIGRGESAS